MKLSNGNVMCIACLLFLLQKDVNRKYQFNKSKILLTYMSVISLKTFLIEPAFAKVFRLVMPVKYLYVQTNAASFNNSKHRRISLSQQE